MTEVAGAGAAAEELLATLAMMAAQGTLAALAALAIVRGRLRPAWQAAVWLVVLIKFVLPWGPALAGSLADLVAMVRGGETAIAAPLILRAGAAPAVEAAPALAPALGWLALAGLWLAGAALVAARALTGYRAALAAARTAPAAPPAATALLASLAAAVRVRTPRLVTGDAATGPHVIGLLRPIIVVPPALLEEPALLRAALLHELAHVRRRDALGRLVQVIARAAFWFFPIVHLASKRLELAREAACDAWALEAGELSRPAYARLLVQMAQLRTAAGAPLAAPRTLDARVAAVLGPPARPRLGWIHRAALAAWIALALGGARAEAAADRENVCIYTPEVAEALRLQYPDADVDGDGRLTREEACDYQAILRKRISAGEASASAGSPALRAWAGSSGDPVSEPLLVEPLCCRCDGGTDEVSTPVSIGGATAASCRADEP